MNIIEKENGTLIEFGNKLNKRIKYLFVFGTLSGISFILIGTKWALDSFNNQLYGVLVFCLVIIITGFMVFYRYLVRILRKDNLFITKETFKIISSTIFNIQERAYEINKIKDLQYLGKSAKTDHPLKGSSFDYLGFETQELVIADVNDEGNLSFKYEEKIIYFGRNVYSWDAEKINDVLSSLTNGLLHIGNIDKNISDTE